MSTSEMINPKKRTVNGPVNVIRLEGNVHGIRKVVYLFMDYHISVSKQTQCKNVFSEDVQKYFVDNFYNLSLRGSKTYDFFVELYPSELADEKYITDTKRKEHKLKYIEEVVKMFKKIFKYDKSKNKVSVNKMFKNVRLHYLDIRDYYKHNIHYEVLDMNDIAHKFMENDHIDSNALDEIINTMQRMRKHLIYIIDVLLKKSGKRGKTPVIIKEPTNPSLDTQSIEYLANKIKESYKYTDVQDAMLELIDKSVDNFNLAIDEVDNAITRFKSYDEILRKSSNRLVKDENSSYIYGYGLSSYTIRKMIIDIVSSIESLVDERFIEFFARFTDIYFLRRFLDKDYITNGIVYSGALHSNTYVHFLINKFNFRVTHASYSKIKDMSKLTKEIAKRDPMEIQELILPTSIIQCSSLEDFPEEFI